MQDTQKISTLIRKFNLAIDSGSWADSIDEDVEECWDSDELGRWRRGERGKGL
jgi:hypothetical protein